MEMPAREIIALVNAEFRKAERDIFSDDRPSAANNKMCQGADAATDTQCDVLGQQANHA
jgi:hypothetical protein